MPIVNIGPMNMHLADIGPSVSVSAIALLILDGAGWHIRHRWWYRTTSFCCLRRLTPELQATENISGYQRGTALSNTVLKTYSVIVDARCKVSNAPIAKPQITASIGSRGWAPVNT